MEILNQNVDRQFFRRHLILSACLVTAIVLVGIGLATGTGLALLGGAFCLAMMASMLWMMVAMGRGHGH